MPAMECVPKTSVEVPEAGDHCRVGEGVESDQEWRVAYDPGSAISTHVRMSVKMVPWSEASWVSISLVGDHLRDFLESEISTWNERWRRPKETANVRCYCNFGD